MTRSVLYNSLIIQGLPRTIGYIQISKHRGLQNGASIDLVSTKRETPSKDTRSKAFVLILWCQDYQDF